MNPGTASPGKAASPSGIHVPLGALVRFASLVIVICVTLFVSAGTVHWPAAWAYAVLVLVTVVGSRLLVLRKNPELLTERGSYRQQEDAKSWDRKLVPIVAIYGPIAGLIVSGLDKRFGWAPMLPVGVQIAGFLVLALSNAFSTWAMVENRFFSAVVRIQKDRGHAVVDSGPYRFVRHPGYAGGLVGFFAGPLALGSLWALIPGVLTAGVVVVRTALEDRTLLAELDGYKEYAQRVRYRLLPGLW